MARAEVVVSPSSGTALDQAAGEQLFLEGRRLRQEGNCTDALSKFTESFRLDPRSGTMLNIAECSLTLGRIATAWAQFGKVQTLAHGQGSNDHLTYATRRIAEIEPKLSWLTVIARNPLPGQRVTRDGIEMSEAQFSLKLPIDPGPHVLVIKAPGYLPRELSVTIGESADSQTVELPMLVPVPAHAAVQAHTPPVNPSVPVRSPSQHVNHSTSPGPWLLGGVGAAALALGSAAGILALVDNQRLAQACPTGQRCTDRDMRLQGRRDLEASTATAAIPMGVVAIGVAVWWWFQDREPSNLGRAPIVTAAVGAGSGNGAIWLTGRFN